MCLICEECFINKDVALPKNLKRENFEISTVYNLFSKERYDKKIIEKINGQKWTDEENKQLIESLKINNNWEEVIKSLGKNNTKTKKDCILHLMQMPVIKLKEEESDKDLNETEKEQEIYKNNEKKELIENEINMNENQKILINSGEEELKENEKEKEKEIKKINKGIKYEEEKKDEEKNDRMNNNMLEIFMRLFKRYLNEMDNNEKNEGENRNIQNKSFKEIIYKTFAKSINKCKELKNEEKNEMKNIVDILVYLEMRKIELKMNYFRQFERLLEYKKTQLKTIETQIIQERIKLITKKLLLQQKQQQAKENK
jgi:SWI/SNF related-matrix-associated actin-dependent regulator of chromatin subfamily C